MDEQRLVHPDIVRMPDLHRHWKRNAWIPAAWIAAECEVAIVRGKRDGSHSRGSPAHRRLWAYI